MDPGPKVVLSEFVLNVINNEANIPRTAIFNLLFLQNGQCLFDSGSMMQNDDGCPVAEFRLIILAIDILVIDVLNPNDDLKLGSIYLDLEDELQPLDDSLHTYDVVMESDDFPAMQLTLKASSFPSSALPATPPIPSFLVLRVCSEETPDTYFLMYCLELYQLLVTDTFLILNGEQFLKLQDRCLALGSAEERVPVFGLFAGLLDNDFRATSDEQMYVASRLLYDDFATALCDLDRPMQHAYITSLPDTDPAKTISMQSFAKSLIDRHVATGNEDDLNQAISWLEAVDRLRAGPCSSDFILDLFNMYEIMYGAYLVRYSLSKNVLDLDKAVASMSKAVKLQVPWLTLDQRAAALRWLAVGMAQRFMHLGAEHDINRALECVDEALAAVLVGSPEHRTYLSMREMILSARFLRSRDISDLDQAWKIREERIADMGNLTRSIKAKRELADLLCDRFLDGKYLEQPDADVDVGIAVFRKRGEQKPGGDEADLIQAIDLYREVADGGSNEGKSLSRALMMRFEYCGDKANLEEAITVMSRMPDESRNNLQLGEALHLRYEHCGGHLEDLRSAISYASRAATSVHLHPMKRFVAARLWSWWALRLPVEDCRSVLMDAYETTMSIIPSMVWIGMPLQDRHDILMTTGVIPMPFTAVRKQTAPRELLGSIGQTPSIAAAFAISVGVFHTAVEWLEQGRSIIWDQLLQFRVPLDKLSQEDPQLAQKLAALAEDLAKSSTTTHFWKTEDGQERTVPLEAEGQKHRRLATEWQEAVADARKLPGFNNFLLPKDFDYLSKGADDAIVVIINVMRVADALIIFPGCTEKDVRHVPLRELTFLDIERMHADLLCLIKDDMGIRSDLTRRPVRKQSSVDPNTTFRKILSDLWYTVVLPIICEAMEYQPSLVNCDEGKNRAHVRWCPTGHLAFLPLHAAGDYSSSAKGHRVWDFVVSSYIPTLNSIIRETPMDSTITVLAVACPYAKDQVPIPDTEEEVTRVGRYVVPLLDQPATPVSRYTALVKKTATAERVLEEMNEATWVHLACHGVQDATSPTSSALLLSGGTRLSLSDIAALNLPQAEFAFLSACQTATGYDKVPSESVHLAAGMLLAGYRSVIGTMWSIADRQAPHVADDVYGFLLRDGTSRRPDYKESAIALHLAMERLRARIGEGSFLAWVPYIHIGV